MLVLFAAVNLLGALLWKRRGKRPPHAALQILLVGLGASGAAAIFTLDRAGVWESIQIGGRVSAVASYFVLAAMILGLMLAFHLRFGRSTEDTETPQRGPLG